MKTKLATLECEDAADSVAGELAARMLPRRGYKAIYHEDNEVFVESVRQPSYDFKYACCLFISGFKAGYSIFN